MACDLEGNFIVTMSAQGDVIRLWNTKTGQKMASFVQEFQSVLCSLHLTRKGLLVYFNDTATVSYYSIPETV